MVVPAHSLIAPRGANRWSMVISSLCVCVQFHVSFFLRERTDCRLTNGSYYVIFGWSVFIMPNPYGLNANASLSQI